MICGKAEHQVRNLWTDGAAGKRFLETQSTREKIYGDIAPGKRFTETQSTREKFYGDIALGKRFTETQSIKENIYGDTEHQGRNLWRDRPSWT